MATIRPLQGDDESNTSATSAGKYPAINGAQLAILVRVIQNGTSSGDFRNFLESSPYSARVQELLLQVMGERPAEFNEPMRSVEELKDPNNLCEEWRSLEQFIKQLLNNVETKAQGVKLSMDYYQKRQAAMDVLTPVVKANSFVTGLTDFLREHTDPELFAKVMTFCEEQI